MARKLGALIEVTADDITKAIRGDSSHCMIAEAIARAKPDVTKVSVDLATIRWSDPKKGERYVFLTPASAQSALLDFDNGEEMQGFRFKLTTPAQIVRCRTGETKVRKAEAKVRRDNGGSGVPTVVGGKTPPRGPLHKGSGSGGRQGKRTGKIRGFGARMMTR